MVAVAQLRLNTLLIVNKQKEWSMAIQMQQQWQQGPRDAPISPRTKYIPISWRGCFILRYHQYRQESQTCIKKKIRAETQSARKVREHRLLQAAGFLTTHGGWRWLTLLRAISKQGLGLHEHRQDIKHAAPATDQLLWRAIAAQVASSSSTWIPKSQFQVFTAFAWHDLLGYVEYEFLHAAPSSPPVPQLTADGSHLTQLSTPKLGLQRNQLPQWERTESSPSKIKVLL